MKSLVDRSAMVTGFANISRNRVLALMFALVPLTVASCATGSPTKSDDAPTGATAEALAAEGNVEIIDHQFPSSSVQAQVISQVFNKLGGDSEVVAIAELAASFPAIAGQTNLFDPEQWRLLTEEPFKKYVDQEQSVTSFSKSRLSGEEGWYVPTYVIEGDEERGIDPVCPGLPNWEALNDCVDVFKTPRTGDKGQFMSVSNAYEPSYGNYARIDNLGLDYQVEFAGSNAALDAEWKRAYDRGEPILAMMWSPSYTGLTLDLTKIELPPYTPECWGTTYACDWGDVGVQSLAHPEFESMYPTYARILRAYDLNDDQFVEIITKVNEDGMDPNEAVAEWLDENPDVWQRWAS